MNGDCPQDAVNAIFKYSTGHVCVVTRDKPEEKPAIDWEADPEPIPEYFKEDHPWDITILEAPICPKTAKIIRLVKTSPFDFDLRTGSK